MCLLGGMFQVRNRSTRRVLLSGALFVTQQLAGTLCLGVYLVFRYVIFVRYATLSEWWKGFIVRYLCGTCFDFGWCVRYF